MIRIPTSAAAARLVAAIIMALALTTFAFGQRIKSKPVSVSQPILAPKPPV